MTSQAYATGRPTDTGHQPAVSDAALLKETIRQSISTSPEAFLKTVDDVESISIDIWEKEIRSCTWAVIQRGREVVGIAVSRWPDLELDTDIDPAAARFIESVWITPGLRDRRMGERLLRYLLEVECAKYPDVKQFLLWVLKENSRAIRLYKRMGFKYRRQQEVRRTSGTELRVEYLMALNTSAVLAVGTAANQVSRQEDLRRLGVSYRILRAGETA